jgi:transposase
LFSLLAPRAALSRPPAQEVIDIKKTDQTDQTQEPGEPAELIERVAALDIGKAGLTACIRVPHATKPGRRRREIAEYATTTGSLLGLADWLRGHGVQVVAMEATSGYWKPVFYLLEAEGFTCWLRNARHVKNVPGRPKTDRLDAVWLAKVVERGRCRPWLVHPARSGGFGTSPATGAP